MKHGVVFAAAVKKRPQTGDECGNDQQAEGEHPIEGFVAAATVGINEIVLDAKYMSGGPESDVLQGPERR